MESKVFSLHEVLAVAKIHPFYAPQVQYPPDPKGVQDALDSATSQQPDAHLQLLPLTTKKSL
jgi:hypothetical protein